MGIKIKYTDPTLNEFSTDDVVINVQSGSLFFKSNTKLFKLQGDDQSTTDISDSLIITGLINSRGPQYTVELDGNHGSGPRINMGTSPFNTSAPNDSDLFMSFGAYGSINNLDTKNRDFHLYGTNTTTGFYFDESTGKFGIGITAPTALLHLGTQGAANQNTDPSLTRLALTPPAHTGGPWNFVTRDSATHAFLDIDYGVTNKITINSDGDMGIGTTTPTAPLHVEVDDDTNNSLVEILHLERHADDLSDNRQAEGGYIGLYVDDDNFGGELARISWRADNANNYEGDGRIGFWTAKSTSGDQGGMALTEKMTLTRDGYLGLGDKTGDQEPTALIHMSGSTFGSSAADGAHYRWINFGGSAYIANITYQSGLFIKCDSSMVLHAGDGYNTGSMGVGNGYTSTTETLWLTADGVVKVKTGMQGTAYTSTFDTAGGLTLGSGASVSSDRRLKKDIYALTSSLNTVKQLEGVSYTWLDNRYDDRIEYGLIAQDVEKVIPGFTVENEDGYKTLNYSSIIPFLIESIKEQQQQIDDLREKLNVK